MSRYALGTHLGVVALFMALALWTMSPVVADVSSAIPATGFGDNATGLWNVWWFLRASGEGQSLYRTNTLFAPFGTQLSLHTHATTHSLLAWPLTKVVSLVAAHNIAIVGGLALNGICAWLLAFRITRAAVPSIAAGVLFAWSAHVQLRVLGHINLVHAWVLPLFAVGLLRLDAKGRLGDAAAVGALAALVVYTDYYYAIYAAVLVVIWAAVRLVSIEVDRLAPRRAGVRRILLGLIGLDLALIAVIVWTGGTALEIGPIRISSRGVRNPLTVLWILVALWAVCRFPFSVRMRLMRHRASPEALRLGLAGIIVLAALSAPLWWALADVIARGDYTTQRVLWRSSPPGADALTLLLGHPRHLLTGAWTTSTYQALAIDVMEQSLWVGLLPILLTVLAWPKIASVPGARLCAAVCLIFLLLALGPFLRVGGVDTALPLPHAVLRYIPGLANARMPGRAVVMVGLGLAVLTALALTSLRSRGQAIVTLFGALLLIETLPAPAAAQRIPGRDAVDELIRSSAAAGAVAELPLGVRDGFGELGSLDHRALVHQIWHERPLVGGFVARLSPGVKVAYTSDPLLANLLEISTPEGHDARLMADASERAEALGIAFVVVNRDTFIGSRLPRADLETAGFELRQTSGARELYSIQASKKPDAP